MPAHIDLAKVDDPGVVGEAVHDRVRRDPVGQLGNSARRTGLRGDHRRQPVFADREDCEQVAGGVAVDADGEEVIDDEQIDVGELVQQLLVGNAVAAGDDEAAGEVVHPEVRTECSLWHAPMASAQAR